MLCLNSPEWELSTDHNYSTSDGKAKTTDVQSSKKQLSDVQETLLFKASGRHSAKILHHNEVAIGM